MRPSAPLSPSRSIAVTVSPPAFSAEQRNNTVRALANGNRGASDFVRPGHVFPLIAKEGGVRDAIRAYRGRVDLCRLAGLPPVGVLAESTNDDGSVMRGPGVAEFAGRHKLRQVSIADLIAYRQTRDKLVKRIGEFPVKSKIGTLQGYAYVTPFDAIQHMAFVYGRIGSGKDVPARLHRADIIRDVFGGAHPVHWRCSASSRKDAGVIVFRDERRRGADSRHPAFWLDRIRVRALAAMAGSWSRRSDPQRPRHYLHSALDLDQDDLDVGLAGFGIEITSTELIDDRAAQSDSWFVDLGRAESLAPFDRDNRDTHSLLLRSDPERLRDAGDPSSLTLHKIVEGEFGDAWHHCRVCLGCPT